MLGPAGDAGPPGLEGQQVSDVYIPEMLEKDIQFKSDHPSIHKEKSSSNLHTACCVVALF